MFIAAVLRWVAGAGVVVSVPRVWKRVCKQILGCVQAPVSPSLAVGIGDVT